MRNSNPSALFLLTILLLGETNKQTNMFILQPDSFRLPTLNDMLQCCVLATSCLSILPMYLFEPKFFFSLCFSLCPAVLNFQRYALVWSIFIHSVGPSVEHLCWNLMYFNSGKNAVIIYLMTFSYFFSFFLGLFVIWNVPLILLFFMPILLILSFSSAFWEIPVALSLIFPTTSAPNFCSLAFNFQKLFFILKFPFLDKIFFLLFCCSIFSYLSEDGQG